MSRKYFFEINFFENVTKTFVFSKIFFFQKISKKNYLKKIEKKCQNKKLFRKNKI